MSALCRAGLHPAACVRTSPSGKRYCASCRAAADRWRALVHPPADPRWEAIPVDEALMASHARWAAGLKAAIDTIRRREGFDGRVQPWQTLGECLLPETPAPLSRTTRCPRCHTALWRGRCCGSCAAGLEMLAS